MYLKNTLFLYQKNLLFFNHTIIWIRSITNHRQFRTAVGILVGVFILSTLFGSLIMYCASFSKLLMISKLTTDSVQEERYITERLFEKINPSVECRKFCESGDICSDVCRGQINIKRLSFNLRLDLVF